MRVVWIVLLVCSASFSLSGQPQDTLPVLSLDEFMHMIRAYHPMYKRAALLQRQAEVTLQRQRGAFDPLLEADLVQKHFESKDYFTRHEGGIRIPTSFGVEFKAGYQQSRGVFLNPEANLPPAGQAFAAVKVPLLRGMLTDQRRTALRQAKLLANLNEATRRQLVNDLLFEGNQIYWSWVLATRERAIQDEAIEVARVRFEASRQQFFQGDIPAVDTLEALIQFQNRVYARAEAEKQLRKIRQELSNFLWNENGNPLVLSDQVTAPNLAGTTPEEDMQTLLNMGLPANHPNLETYRWKLEQLEVERRLKLEYLKPKLDVEYNFLANGSDFLSGASDDVSTATALLNENYKWGVQFSFPIFLRTARADVQLTDVKILETDLDQKNKRLELQNKLNAYQNQYIIGREQLAILEDVRNNYERLLAAENEKFRIGESSLFLLNSREQKLIEANIKLARLRAKLSILESGMQWAAGLLQ